MKTKSLPPMTRPAAYRIKVQGTVEPRWSDRFSSLSLAVDLDSAQTPLTTITGLVPDQAALRGILNQLWDMNLTLISVSLISVTPEMEARHDC
jgi:hypothetical protein